METSTILKTDRWKRCWDRQENVLKCLHRKNWEADDEFPASGKVLVDAMAEHYLEMEAAGGACSAVIQEIRKQIHCE